MGGDKGLRICTCTRAPKWKQCLAFWLNMSEKTLAERLISVRKNKINTTAYTYSMLVKWLPWMKNLFPHWRRKRLFYGQGDWIGQRSTSKCHGHCGNTGALMAGGTLRLPHSGIDRPALAAIIPSKKDPFVFLDVGANPESDPTNLMHNAISVTCKARRYKTRKLAYWQSVLSKEKARRTLSKPIPTWIK